MRVRNVAGHQWFFLKKEVSFFTLRIPFYQFYQSIIILLIFSTFFLLASCTSEEKSDPKTLIVALSSTPNSLDPRTATDANSMRITDLLFQSLVRVGSDLKIVGDAAQKWFYKDLTYQFILHPNLTFSNGREVSIDDILFSFEQFQSSNSPFQGALKAIKEVKAFKGENNALVVLLKLNMFSATLLTDLFPLKILPKKEILENSELFFKNPMGSGSYTFVSQNASEIVLKARDKHSLSVPKIPQLIFKIIRDDNTRYLKVIKGNIDIIQSDLPPSKVDSLRNNPNLEVITYPGLSFTYLLLNLKDPLLSQIKLRKAFSHSLNREEIIKYHLHDLAAVATSILSPGNPFFNKDLKNLPFDQSKAKNLIEELKIDKNITLTLKTSNNQSAMENGRIIAKQMEATGLKINLQSFEWGTFYEDIKKGNFQLATMKWVGVTDPDIYRLAFHSSEFPPGRNRGSYLNPSLDSLLEVGLKIEDQDQRMRHYNEIQAIILQELPIIPLWYDTQVAVVHKRVKGFSPSQNGDLRPLIAVSKQ